MRNLSRILFASLGASVAVPVLAVGLQIGHRPEIGGIAAPKTVKPGEIVKITVSASGKEITTHKACKGKASAVIQVGAPAKAAKTPAKAKS